MVKIVVIGDSIAKGVGSTDVETKNFGALIGEKVQGEVTNLGIAGLDSSQLLEKLGTKKFQNAIGEADVIFVSIGSNDLLKPFTATIAKAAGVAADPSGKSKELYAGLRKQFSKMSKENPLKAGDALATAVKELENSSKLDAACKKFPENFEKIVQEIQRQNPEAVIYVDNIYNPYYGVVYEYEGMTLLNIHDLCEKYIVEMNKAFDRNSEDYRLLDIYSIFRQTGYTNVNPASLKNMSGVNFDPHPNDAGYQLMADYMYTQMDSIAPEVEILFAVDVPDIPVDVEEMQLLISEKVRPIAGKKIQLTGNGETYSYVLTGQEKPEELESGSVYFTIPMEAFLGDQKTLDYNTNYTVTMEQGAFKDSGNNSPNEEEVGFFQTQTKAEIAANARTVVNQPLQENTAQAHQIIGISVSVFLLIAVAIGIFMRYNGRVRKEKSRNDKQ